MTKYELLDLIARLNKGGYEDPSIAVMRCRNELPGDMWKTLSAFANYNGGTIILGAEWSENGLEIHGVQDIPDITESVRVLCGQMAPKLDVLLDNFSIEGKDIIVLETGELSPEEKPCYYRGHGIYGGSCIRTGSGNRILSPYEIQSISECVRQPRYDTDPIDNVYLRELEPSLVKSFIRRIRERPGTPFSEWTDEEILKACSVLVKDRHGKYVVSLAGWLCFALYPQKLFPSLCVTLMRFPTPVAGETGPDGERFLDNIKIEGPIPHMIVETVKAVKRNMSRRDVVRGLVREEHWEYPIELIREAIINSLGHRDYSPRARGCQVQVLMFPDRIEIISPGGIFGAILPDQLGDPGVQSSRNEILMNILEDLAPAGETRSLCENRGSGLASVMVACRKEKLSPPSFKVDLSRFRIVASNRTLFDQETLDWLDMIGRGWTLTENQRFGMAHIRHVGWINNADYCRLTGSDSRVATRELGELVSGGLLDRMGSGRWSTYHLSSDSSEKQQFLF